MSCGILLVFLGLLSLSKAVELELTIEIDPAKRECFHEEIQQGVTIEFEYQVSCGVECGWICAVSISG